MRPDGVGQAWVRFESTEDGSVTVEGDRWGLSIEGNLDITAGTANGATRVGGDDLTFHAERHDSQTGSASCAVCHFRGDMFPLPASHTWETWDPPNCLDCHQFRE